MTTHTWHLGDKRLDDHTILVPLVHPQLAHQQPADSSLPATIEVFARVITPAGGDDLPYLLYLQGGPGGEAPRNLDPWILSALRFFRVVLLDQRGTGRSTPVGGDILPASYLRQLRADAIVCDAEALREHLGVAQWSALGQSFGGFCLLHYLSAYPGSLDQVFFTGGLPAIGRDPVEIYRATYDSMRRHSEEFYRRLPQLRDPMRQLVELAEEQRIILPDGEVVDPWRIRSLGHLLGSDDGWQQLAALLDLGPTSPAFRYDLARLLPFSGRNPLYYLLHESCYADGFATHWAAQRALPEDYLTDPTLLTAEHVSPSLIDVPAFRPWAKVAEELAHTSWPRLYDSAALRNSGARGAAAIYARDAYVPLTFSLETVDLLPQVIPWVTSEYEHSGLRSSAGAVIEHLIALAAGRRWR